MQTAGVPFRDKAGFQYSGDHSRGVKVDQKRAESWRMIHLIEDIPKLAPRMSVDDVDALLAVRRRSCSSAESDWSQYFPACLAQSIHPVYGSAAHTLTSHFVPDVSLQEISEFGITYVPVSVFGAVFTVIWNINPKSEGGSYIGVASKACEDKAVTYSNKFYDFAEAVEYARAELKRVAESCQAAARRVEHGIRNATQI